jgi:putative salt-induced outer membrane protein
MRTPFLVSLCLLAPAILAQQPEDPITGSAALGYLATSGNTDSSNANASFQLGWDPGGLWTHEWTALAVTSRTDSVTTAAAYAAGYKALRALSETDYLFAAGDWRQDRFSGYDRQITEAIGYGRRLISVDRQTLSVEGGIGAKQSKLIDGTSFDEGIVRGGLDYVLRITESSQFNQRLLAELGDDNRYTESVSALRMRLINNIAVVLSYTIKNNSDVPPGIERTDTFTAISFEYGF